MEFSAEAARDVLADMTAAQQRRRQAEFEEFELAVRWAHVYRHVPKRSGYVIEGTERLVQWAGEGTPAIAEFCTFELAAGLGMDELQARLWVRDAVETHYRLPKTWQALRDGRIRVWHARTLAERTCELTIEQAGAIDADLEQMWGAMSWRRIDEFIKARVLEYQAESVERQREFGRHYQWVKLHQSETGGCHVDAKISSADGVFLDATLNRFASILAMGGNTQPHAVRRAIALGLLASPARALQLQQAALTDELLQMGDEEFDAECPARGQRGHTCGQVTVDPEALLPEADMIVHLTDETVGSGEGLARVEKVGPVLAGWVKDLLGHARVTVRPVLNPEMLVASDSYECPPRMREWVQLRDGFEAFPHSTKRSQRRGMDMDHTEPYAWDDHGGPAEFGQTRPDNLAPLSRRAHRAKTHGGWEMAQPLEGVKIWRSPLGFGYLMTPSHVWMIDDPSGRILPKQGPPGSWQPDQLARSA